MHNQRRIVVLLRWVMFIALAYLLWGTGGLDSWPEATLLVLVAGTNLALARLSLGRWEHPALLPVVAVLDIAVLTASMLVGHGFAKDFFFAYFVMLAAVAMLPTLRWASFATILIVAGYGTLLALDHGWQIVQAPGLLGRLGFLFSIGITYGGLTETGKVWIREAALQSELVGWVGKLSSAFSDEFDSFEVIRQILLDLQKIYPVGVRASVVQIADGEIHVISSGDDPNVRQLGLDPARYPELAEVVESGEPLVIENLRERHSELEGLSFNTLLLCPVNLRDPSMGHVVLRVARESAPFTPGVIRTTQHVAEAIGVIFRQAKMRELMERSERMEVVSQVTTSVAHSFNGLLSTVLLSAESLRREAESSGTCDDDCAKKFRAIDLAVKEGMTIVERLTAWTRLQRDPGGDGERNRVLDPKRLLEDAWRYAQPHWLRREATRDLELRLEVEDTARVMGHAAELREVLLNLIINAIDAMPKGGVLTLGIDEEESRVRFTVTDNGIGMSEEQLARVFEPLYTTKGSAGTGLGLTIARSVAHRHRGEIVAESRPGVGSRFCLYLPSTEARANLLEGGAEEAEETRDDGAASRRVLLVDGNELVRDVMVRLLQTLDYELDTAGSPDEALVLLNAGRRYRGMLIDAGAVGGRAGNFLGQIEDSVPGLAGRLLFYSTRGRSEELKSLQETHRFGYVDRSAGLAALTDALKAQLGEESPGREAAA